MTPVGIYIHVPFCAKKCPYCDFYSCGYSLQSAEKYINAVIRDINSLPENICADTVYFGGGTPSLLPAEMLKKILETLNNHCSITAPEITIEINPCTVNEEKLLQYRKMGINRLSLGVQSADDRELEFLGRNHSWEKAKEIINLSVKNGFENISCDIMTGLPRQSFDTLKTTIDKISALPVTHISSYILKIEEDTPFDTPDIINQLPDDDYVSDLYLFMVSQLENHGYKQYEISNFSKPGFESRHNLKYWKCREYIGLGPSAHSYFDGKRYYIPSDLNDYRKQSEKIITEENPGSNEEKIMLGLRLTEGINVNDFPDKKDFILKKSGLFQKSGLVNIQNNTVSLTPSGFLVSNSIISELI